MFPLPKIGPGQGFKPLRIGPGQRVFVLTGAGISAESGVRTFRDAGGLWEEHRIEDVATPEGFARDPRLVWRFYAERRRQVGTVHPNPAHLALAALQQQIGERLFLCTQNVDPLHEKAGSSGVLHMHGELLMSRCSDCGREPFRDETAWNRIYNTLGQRAMHKGIGMWDPTTCGAGPSQDVPLKVWVIVMRVEMLKSYGVTRDVAAVSSSHIGGTWLAGGRAGVAAALVRLSSSPTFRQETRTPWPISFMSTS